MINRRIETEETLEEKQEIRVQNRNKDEGIKERMREEGHSRKNDGEQK